MASRPAVNLSRHSRRSCARCSIIRLGELRRHEAARGGTSPRSPYPVAGTRRHSGITSSMAWLSTLRMRSIPWSFQLAWKVDRSRYQGRFLSVSGTEEGDFSASASRVPPRQLPLVRHSLNALSSRRRSQCRSEEHD